MPFIFLLIFALPACTPHSLTFTAQQVKQLHIKQQHQYQKFVSNFETDQKFTTCLLPKQAYMTRNLEIGKQIKVRGKAYFVNHQKHFINHTITPYDMTKIYIYAQNGVIVQSEEFALLFAFSFIVKQQGQFMIVVTDTQLGPSKLLQIQLHYSRNIFKQVLPLIPYNSYFTSYIRMSVLQTQLSQNLISKIGWLQKSQNMNHFLETSNLYFDYILFETVIVIIVSIVQIGIVISMLNRNGYEVI